MKKKQPGLIGETVRTVIIAVTIAIVIRVFAYEPFNIPSGSMKPTLLVGDYLFVSKFSYGYSRYSLPWGLPLIDDRVFASPPKRGDVLVFKFPPDNSTDYIKRVIGLPGDRIQVISGILHINGNAVPRRKIGPNIIVKESGHAQRVVEYVETLPNGVEHRIFEVSDSYPSADNTKIFTVPPGHYFMMGDNRDNSSDSRFGVGFVPFRNLIGRAEFLFFSHEASAKLLKPWTWPTAIRYSRIFDGVE